MEDRVLLKGVLHGSLHAFKRIVSEYGPLVSRTSYRILCDRSDSEFVAREVFVFLWHDPLAFMTDRTLAHELLKKTSRSCRKRLMLRKLYDIFSVRPDIFVVQTSPDVSRDEYIARQVWEVFCRASSHCTDRQRIVYSLHELEGVPLSETAEVGYYLPFTVEEALEEARSSVKEELDRYGRISDYNAYVGYLRNIDNQLIDRSKLMNNIMQEIFS